MYVIVAKFEIQVLEPLHSKYCQHKSLMVKNFDEFVEWLAIPANLFLLMFLL